MEKLLNTLQRRSGKKLLKTLKRRSWKKTQNTLKAHALTSFTVLLMR